ncbi:MAG: protein-glutamate methylesterase/protein-glutamine glutaminase [Thermoanaerobaculia bacterium]
MRPPLHVLVVDDSAVVRQTLRAILQSQPDIRVTVAADAVIAQERLRRQRADVIVLDLEMPRMDGLTFLRTLMRVDPVPVVVCSGRVGGGTSDAMQALREGAVELIAKPRVGVRGFLEESAVLIVDAVRAAAQTTLRRRPGSAPREVRPLRHHATAPRVVAIGASTGGTDALRALLGALPADMCAVAVVQHMPSPFTRQFAEHLNEVSPLVVREAVDGDELRNGTALVAPGDRHMTVRSSGTRMVVALHDGPLVSRHRPSVDVLFRSVAETIGASAVGVILTGMGADGATGLLEMRKAGATTIAQDEESCVVFGMPREAIARGAVEAVLPLDAIPAALAAAVTAPAAGRRCK